MKNSNIAAIAGIALAGVAAYFVVRKFQGAGDSIGKLITKVADEAKVIGKKIAAGPGAVTDDQGERVPVMDQLRTSGGIGLKAPSGSYISQATRYGLAGGSMLLTDAEKAAIRAADSGTPTDKARAVYGLFTPADFNRIDGFLSDSHNPNDASYSLIN